MASTVVRQSAEGGRFASQKGWGREGFLQEEALEMSEGKDGSCLRGF